MDSRQEQKKEPNLSDIGTRYEHFQEHLDSLNACIDAMKPRCYTQEQKNALIKMTIAAEVMQATLDSYVGMKESGVEYSLYRLIKSVPTNPADIEGGRGTPLI